MEIPLQAIKNLVGTDYGYTFDQVNFESLVFHDKVKRVNKSDYDIEVIRLEKAYSDNEYARKREAEYPSLLELTVALYDTDDKSAVEAKRASVKLKYPKPS
jgi:hypothetical protein